MTGADRFDHALVMGKFFPPHLGHQLLVEEAARRSERVTVLVLAAAWEGLPLDRRVEWLRQIHADTPGVEVVGAPCDIPVDLDSEAIWRAHVALVSALLSPDGVDALFTSEAYGDELARRLGAVHVSVDPARRSQPVSSSAVRRDVEGQWDLLPPVVRAGLATRVVVLGAESTGTTTVSRALAEHYRRRGGVLARTGWVAEYGRQHTVVKQRTVEEAANAAGRPAPPMAELEWTADDFALVARTQQCWEDTSAAEGSPVLVCDTDAVATVVWERRYRGPESRAAAPVADRRRPGDALYLLTDHTDVSFVQDGWRDGEHVRDQMTGWFVDELVRRRLSWALLTGSLEERVALAVRLTDLASAARWERWLKTPSLT